MPYATSGQTPRKPPRRFAPPVPPLPPYLPCRFVTHEQHGDIWPDEFGKPYPTHNSEYPRVPGGWSEIHDENFHQWLLLKNVEPNWFHQTSSFKAKSKLLLEFVRSWNGYGEMPIPRSLWIQSYGGHQDMFYNPNAVNRPLAYIIKFIGRLNRLVEADKPKRENQR